MADEDAASTPPETLSLLDEGSLPALVVDPRQGRVQAANRALIEALKLEGETIEGSPLRALVHPEDHDLVDAMLEALQEGANLAPTRVLLQHPSMGGARASLWARVPSPDEALRGAIVLLCRPFEQDPLNPWNHRGFGRIPPSWELAQG